MQTFIAGLEAAPADGTVFPGDGVNGPALRYQDNGDGTITDLNTGLMWEKKTGTVGSPDSTACLTALHDVNSTCTWAQGTGAWINAVNAEGGTGLAGHSDWRVPNIKELQSIVDYGRCAPVSGPPCVDQAAIDPDFGPTAASDYWSSTTFVGFPTDAWRVNLFFGGVDRFFKLDPLHVRAVRGGQ